MEAMDRDEHKLIQPSGFVEAKTGNLVLAARRGRPLCT
jgi:hypothetical protein